MKKFWNVLTVLALASTVAASSSAQTLGDVARKEEARRKQIKKPAKVYTNDSLRGDQTTASPAQPQTAGSQAVPQAPSAAAQQPAQTPEDNAKKDQKFWRDRMMQAREALDRAQIFQEALQTRINSLTADFTSRDDPAQRNVIAANRQKALDELARVKQEIDQHNKAIAAIEEEARRAGVPAGWLR